MQLPEGGSTSVVAILRSQNKTSGERNIEEREEKQTGWGAYPWTGAPCCCGGGPP